MTILLRDFEDIGFVIEASLRSLILGILPILMGAGAGTGTG